MATGTVQIQLISASGQRINITGLKTNVTPEMLQDSTTGKAQAWDNFARAIAGLSQYTYADTVIAYGFSINEILAEQEG